MQPLGPVICSFENCREAAMTHHLVPSDHVEAVAVYSRDGQSIGVIERLMLEKAQWPTQW